MRLLAVDHFFDQDLDALRAALAPGDELVAVPYQRLHRIARRAFDADAFTGVDAAMSERHTAGWTRYQQPADALTDWLLAAYRPHALVLPSDAIFYLRPVITRAKAAGVPTVVVQKETTISPMVMDQHALAVARAVPFMSDAMTVCSERQREFWVRAGSDPERIVVTGQPRFDVYAQTPRRSRDHVAGRPRLLYLSYDDAAYLPSDLGATYEGSWRDLRRETEEALQAASGRWDVQVKHHPQQPAADDWLGDAVVRAPRDADTRRLILDADIVVGFQTTALFEAVAAGKPVVYAAWGETFERAKPLLIPFHDHTEAVTHARSADELRALLQQPPHELPTAGGDALGWVTSHIGPVDGLASQRALDVVRGLAAADAPDVRAPTTQAWRARVLGAASGLLRLVPSDVLRRRARDWAQERDELRRIRARG